MADKVRKTFLIDRNINMALAKSAADSSMTRNDVVLRILENSLDLPANDTALPLTLEIVNRAEAQIDWSVGYLDGLPVVGDGQGQWYCVSESTVVVNDFEGLVWRLVESAWASVSKRDWDGPVTDSREWIEEGYDYIEESEESQSEGA